MNVALPLDDAKLLGLAPVDLVNQRDERYQGDGASTVLAEFGVQDRATIERLYSGLIQLFDLLAVDQTKVDLPAISALLKTLGWSELMQQMQQLGAHTPAKALRVRQALHDIKGGSLVALSINLQLLEMGLTEQFDSVRFFFLTRDHLKIMRNAVSDLDEERSARDRQQREHTVDLLVEKWQQSEYRVGEAQAEVLVDNRFSGSISERCLEFSALDRVLYNQINNAVRFTTDGNVYLAILGLGAPAENVRFVVLNQISAEHRQVLRERFGDDIGQLYAGGFTTGGSGLGMNICAGFVGNAYGIFGAERALEQGYFGATLLDSYFVSWFHWPVAAD